MIRSKKLPARAIISVLVLVLCVFAIIYTFNLSYKNTAYADDGEAAAEPVAETQEINYKLYIVIGIAVVMLIAIIIVVAVACKKYIISFMVGKNAQPLPPLKYRAGEDIDYLPIPKREDAKFGGWYADPYLRQPFQLTNMPKENIGVYAKWKTKNRWYYVNRNRK